MCLQTWLLSSLALACACCRGLEVSVKELGPAYRVACRDRASGRVLGVTSGFIVPLLGLMHCDTLQVHSRLGAWW